MSCAATPDELCRGCAARDRRSRRVSGHQPKWRGPCANETKAWCKRAGPLCKARPRCKHRSIGSDELIQKMLIWACTDVSVICTTVSCAMQVGWVSTFMTCTPALITNFLLHAFGLQQVTALMGHHPRNYGAQAHGRQSGKSSLGLDLV